MPSRALSFPLSLSLPLSFSLFHPASLDYETRRTAQRGTGRPRRFFLFCLLSSFSFCRRRLGTNRQGRKQGTFCLVSLVSLVSVSFLRPGEPCAETTTQSEAFHRGPRTGGHRLPEAARGRFCARARERTAAHPTGRLIAPRSPIWARRSADGPSAIRGSPGRLCSCSRAIDARAAPAAKPRDEKSVCQKLDDGEEGGGLLAVHRTSYFPCVERRRAVRKVGPLSLSCRPLAEWAPTWPCAWPCAGKARSGRMGQALGARRSHVLSRGEGAGGRSFSLFSVSSLACPVDGNDDALRRSTS